MISLKYFSTTELFLAAMLLASAAATADESAFTNTLARVAAQVREQNPSLVSARLQLREIEALGRQSGLLANPSVDTGLSHNAKFGEVGFELGFSQAFPLTARLRLEKEVSRQELAIARAEVADVERRLVSEAQSLATRYLALTEEKALRERQIQVADELADFIEAAVRKGEGSPLDAGQARLETAQLKQELLQHELAAHEIMHELRPLLGMDAGSEPQLAGTLPGLELPAADLPAPDGRPDYQVLEKSIEMARHEIELERARRKADITVGLFGEVSRQEDAPIGVETEGRVGFRVSLPLPWWNKNEGNIAAKELKQERLQAELMSLAREIRIEAESARHERAAHARLADEVNTSLLPLARQQLEQAESAYRTGQADLESVLRVRDQLIKLELARLHAVRDFHLARLRYDAAIGGTTEEPR